MDYHGIRWATMASSQTTTNNYRGLFMDYHVLWFMDYHVLFIDSHGLPWATMNNYGGPWTVRELPCTVVRGSPW